ncbi:uncharacterized protein ACRADG_012543 [Cochliomyia hominivorax]
MLKESKITLILLICLINILLISADTKILRDLSTFGEASQRHDVISLDNEENLTIKGSYVEHFEIPYDSKNRLTVTVVYVADKNGFKVNYMFVKKEYQRPAFLNITTLKASAG